MDNFKVSFCDPFLEGVTEYGEKGRLEVIPLYQSIPWLQLNEAICSRQNEVHNYFYFFEVRYDDSEGLTHTLNIAADYVPGSLRQEDLRFTIRYIRPKIRKRWFGREKLDKTFLSEREDKDERSVISCLIAFMERDYEFVERHFEAL